MESKREIKFLTYNVWSREDMVVRWRMEAIGKLVTRHKPDVIFFQEVTPHILRIFKSFSWWEDYTCSPVEEEIASGQHFCLMNSSTDRCYLEAVVKPGGGMMPILVATTQLESPDPPAAMRCLERAAQAELAVNSLNRGDNVVFGGDMSWDDKVDLPFPLLDGWVDAAEKLGYCNYVTYDELWNRDPIKAVHELRYMVYESLYEGSITQRRSDRFMCKLKDYELRRMEFIGDESTITVLNDRNETMDLLPSSHCGVVLSIVPKAHRRTTSVLERW